MSDAAFAPRRRQIRLGLVLNGGVSLAIWIGGVTHEIDNLRRAAPTSGRTTTDSTSALYRALLEILDEDVIVDVIAGASAGGINGVMLATAIYNGRDLPNLRETWIGLGDFQKLLRSPGSPNPPSLMEGDKVVLPEMERMINDLYESPPTRLSYPLYLYVTATDLFGYERLYYDSTGRAFEESDSRRRLAFWSEAPAVAVHGPNGVMRRVVRFGDDDARKLLAAAARSTSSFPVAFEAHQLEFFEPRVSRTGGRTRPERKLHWMIDGGVLDNQPFNPVLDRISVIPTDRAVGRIVAYVVPYVNEPGSLNKPAREYATARETMTAASTLPRDVPKLESLDRVTAESEAQSLAEADRQRFWAAMKAAPQEMREAAVNLFPSYRKTRYAGAIEVWNAWAAPDFAPGEGVIAQDPALDPRVVPALFGPQLPRRNGVTDEKLAAASGWIPSSPYWREQLPSWDWGLAPAERVAAWALLFLDDAGDQAEDLGLEEELNDARRLASKAVEAIRKTKAEVYTAFRGTSGELPDRANAAYTLVSGEAVQVVLVQLNRDLVSLRERGLDLPRIDELLHLEVIRNAFSIDDPRVPFPFEFLFMSAGIRNSLGHESSTPQTKLAGMKLAHFAGFLKRSWRANDWLWGRLDGVEHMLRALLEHEYLVRLRERRPEIGERFAAFAFSQSDPEERALVQAAWRDAIGYQTAIENQKRVESDSWARVARIAGNGSARDQFLKLFAHATDPDPETKPDVAARCLDCCRSALAARIQLVVLAEDLERVATAAAEDIEQAAAGARRASSGRVSSSSATNSCSGPTRFR